MLLEYFWWGSVFLLAVPVMLLLLVLGPVLLPEYRDPGAGRLDLISAAISLVAVVLIVDIGEAYEVVRLLEGRVGYHLNLTTSNAWISGGRGVEVEVLGSLRRATRLPFCSLAAR